MILAETNFWDFLNANGGGVAIFVIIMTVLIIAGSIAITEARQGR